MKVACITLGCRTNQHDTAEMQTLLEKEGFVMVNQREKADAYVINTCTVTQKSDTSSRQAVKKSLELNPDALVVFTGCYAQLNSEEAAALPGLDLVLGNADKLEIAKLLKTKLRRWKNLRSQKLLCQISIKREFLELSRSKAFKE